MEYFLMTIMGLMACFLIILVLIQRGRGGGLAGALGGAGGTSAFGTKAGDMFTRITIVTAAIWILLCIITTAYVSHSSPLSAGQPRIDAGSDSGAATTDTDGAGTDNSGTGNTGTDNSGTNN